MTDNHDVGGLSTLSHPDPTIPGPTWFVHGGIKGGTGFSRAIYEQFETLAERTSAHITDCDCGRRRVCPLCVMSEDCGNNNDPLDTATGTMILNDLLAAFADRWYPRPAVRRPLSSLRTTTEKRAQYEAVQFEIERADSVRVRNGSHADPSQHEYTVDVRADGTPTACTCPACEHYDGACKHMVAVVIRDPVRDAPPSQTIRVATRTLTASALGTASGVPAGFE